MPLNLPELDETALSKPPLVVVICQVRFEQNLVVSDGDTGIRIHEKLGGRHGEYCWIEPLQTMAAQIEISPYGYNQGLATGIQMSGWRLKSEDSSWTVTILPDSASLETTSYTTWKGDFEERFKALLSALVEHVDPSVEQRLGLRYVNRIPTDTRRKPQDWVEVIASDLIAPLRGPFWAQGLRNSQSQLEFDIENGAKCLVRHGFVYDQLGNLDGYALDYDVFRQTAQRFDSGQIEAALEHFHHAALSVFQQSLTSSYLASLR